MLTAATLWWLGRRYLLRPAGLSLKSALGVDLDSRRLLTLLVFGFVLFGIDQICNPLAAMTLAPLGLYGWGGVPPPVDPSWDWTIALGATETILVTPIVEEVLFRGLLYGVLRSRVGPFAAALLSGVAFSAIHVGDATRTLSLMLGGIVYALGYERSRSLLPCVVAHSLNNGLSVLLRWV